MRKGRYVVKTVPLTTNNLTKGIINYLDSQGHKASRINTEGQYSEQLEQWIRSGSTPGVSDVICCLKPFGILLVVEVKFGKDDLRPDQKTWLKDIQEAGGIIFVAENLGDFITFYETIIVPAIKRIMSGEAIFHGIVTDIKKQSKN